MCTSWYGLAKTGGWPSLFREDKPPNAHADVIFIARPPPCSSRAQLHKLHRRYTRTTRGTGTRTAGMSSTPSRANACPWSSTASLWTWARVCVCVCAGRGAGSNNLHHKYRTPEYVHIFLPCEHEQGHVGQPG
jgi:hypothetical protein